MPQYYGRTHRHRASKVPVCRNQEVLLMKNFRSRGLYRSLVKAAFFLFAFVVDAHHSLAIFDRTRETQYRVSVTSFEWVNPHASFSATVQPGGAVWVFELPGP